MRNLPGVPIEKSEIVHSRNESTHLIDVSLLTDVFALN